jgi:hypothetical protein
MGQPGGATGERNIERKLMFSSSNQGSQIPVAILGDAG